MLFKKSFQTIVLGFVLWVCLLLSADYNPTMATTLNMEAKSVSQGQIQTLSEDVLNLKPEVDRFLTSIPSGYYTIATIEDLKSFLENSKPVLVDVREPSEYRSGHIPNAINIPLRTLTHHLDKVGRDRPVVLYCSTGYRSAMGVMTLHLLGYEHVKGFPPSFTGWKTAGEAIAKSGFGKNHGIGVFNLGNLNVSTLNMLSLRIGLSWEGHNILNFTFRAIAILAKNNGAI
jgi:rhodanese-related sulfurtransferase